MQIVFKRLSHLTALLLLTALMARAASEPTAASNSGDAIPVSSAARSDNVISAGRLESLQDAGITVGFVYRAEAMSKVYGGLTRHNGIAYLGSIETALTFDLRKLKIGRGQLLISGQNLHGRSINQRYIGAEQSPSNLDNGGFTRFVEAYYSDAYLDERVKIRLGRQYADSEFNATESSSDFLNAAYGLIPTIPMPTYPAPALGLSGSAQLKQGLSLAAGIYKARGGELEGDADSPGNPKVPHVGLFTIVQSTFNVRRTNVFRGQYQVGVWQQARSSYVVALAGPKYAVRNYGFYGTLERPLFTEDRGAEHEPTLFVRFGWAPPDRNEVTSHLAAGISWPAIVRRRANDVAGIGVSEVRLCDGDREIVTELFYKLRVARQFSLTPDIQWVYKQGFANKHALLGGMRVAFEL